VLVLWGGILTITDAIGLTEGAFDSFAARALPALQKVSKELKEATTGFGDLIVGSEEAGTGVEETFEGVANKAEEVRTEIEDNPITVTVTDGGSIVALKDSLNQIVDEVTGEITTFPLPPIVTSLVSEGVIAELRETTEAIIRTTNEARVEDATLIRLTSTYLDLANASQVTRDKFIALLKQFDGTEEEAEQARVALRALADELREAAGIAPRTGFALFGVGDSAKKATTGLSQLQSGLANTQAQLNDTGAAARQAASDIAGVGDASAEVGAGLGVTGRGETRSLGPIVQGDVNDPANIQRALNTLQAQLRGVTLRPGTGLAAPFGRIQQASLVAQIGILQDNLIVAQEQQNQAIIDTIVNTFIGQGLTGQELTLAVEQALATQARFGGTGTSTTANTTASFGSLQTRTGAF